MVTSMHCAVIIEQFVYLFDTVGLPSLRTSRSDDVSATAWLALGDLDSLVGLITLSETVWTGLKCPQSL